MWDKSNKILGVLGGMGPLATQLFYKKIIEKTNATRDQEHLDMIILNHASMPDRTEAILGGFGEDLYTALLEDARRLVDNGAAVIAIPCNTSHLFVNQLQKEISVPIINMIQETIKALATRLDRIKDVGILATDGTLQSGLYQNACINAGIRPVIPSSEIQKLVMKIIYDGIKNGGEIDYNDFIAIESELSANGCQAVIMACTELSCFKEIYRLPDYYIDAMEILVERSIVACGKEVRK